MMNPLRLLPAIIPSLVILLAPPSVPASDYGYLLAEDQLCTIWWAEGAFKVMRTDPVPKAKKNAISIACAGNEYEPFLLVLRPKARMDRVRVEASALRHTSGFELPAENISVCHVEYVRITAPTDSIGTAGEWPDPLPPYDGPFTAPMGDNHALWVTVHVPAGANPGLYTGKITLASGDWKKEIPISLNVWNFSLPEKASIRSSFGLPSQQVNTYHNLETREELEKVMDLYFQNFRDHRLCPTSPLELYPMKVKVSGVYWKGGEFVSEPVHSGRRALKIVDSDVSSNIEVRYEDLISVEPNRTYKLSWQAKTETENQDYTILLECSNAEGKILPAWNVLKIFKGSTEWKQESFEVKNLSPEVKGLNLHVFPCFRNNNGSTTGTAYFDDFRLEVAGPAPASENLVKGGDFEMNTDEMSVSVDFSEFDRGARRYLDELGFNSFDLSLEGMGTGSFYSRTEGVFAGFKQGTPEYEKLFGQYLSQVQDHLEKNGWLGKEYIYWFDEPDEKDYPFVRDGMNRIRKAASKLTRFITEDQPGPAIMDVSEISCTIFDRVNPKIIAELVPRGREFWSYLCTGPKSPWVSLFIDHPAVNLRIWPWMTYQFRMKGILVWRANYWNSSSLFPPDILQNPWEDPMSYVVGYGVPYGQVNSWGNGDGRFLYPPNRDPNRDKTKYLCGPVNSIRWEILREGIEDYEYFVLLEKAAKNAGPEKRALADKARELLNLPESLFKSGKEYTRDPQDLLNYRQKIALLLEKLIAAGGKS
jgi:Glycoside hydrolase 123, catalytic domain/Glycoside hydrolase 123 N-terminal domain